MILARHRALVLRLVESKRWSVQQSMRLPWIVPARCNERLHKLMLAAQKVDDNHHAPCCPANHYHRARLVFRPCSCGATR